MLLLRGLLGRAAAAAAAAGRGPGPGRGLRRLSQAGGPEYAADLAGIRAAAERLAGYARETPVLTSRTLDEMAGRKLVRRGARRVAADVATSRRRRRAED